MAIVDGNNVNAAYTNSVLASKTVDNTLAGIQTLSNGDAASGAAITNIQQRMNELIDAMGWDGDGSGTNNDYSSNVVISDGTDRRAAIDALDAKFAAFALNELSNVDAAAPANGEVLAYNSGTGNWEATAGAGGVTSLNDLSDVDLTTAPTDTQILIYNNGTGNFEPGNQSAGAVAELTDIGDVGGPVSAFQVMVRNAANTAYEFVSQLTNIIIGGGTASATNKLKLSEDTNANLTALARDAGAIYRDTTNNVIVYDDGTSLIDLTQGTGGGGLNVNSTVMQSLGTFTVPASTFFQGNVFAGATEANSLDTRYGYSAFFDGSSGAAVATQSENIAGWVTSITRTGTGVYEVDFTGLGLTVIPTCFATIDDKATNNDNKSAYITAQSTTGCTVKTGEVDGDVDFDFSLQIVLQGADALAFGAVDFMYSANFNGSAGGSVATQTENVAGWVDSITNNATGRFTVNYASLGLTQPPIILLETVSSSTGSDQFTSVLTISNTQVFLSQRNSGGSQNFDFNIILIPDSADRADFPAGLNYAAKINKAGSSASINEENIAGWASVTHLATSTVTLDYSGLNLDNEPVIICTSINGAASSERDGAFVQSKSNTQAVIKRGRNTTTNPDDDTYVLLIPQGSDFAGSGATLGTDYNQALTLGAGSVVELDGSNIKVDDIVVAALTSFDEAKISGVLYDA